VKNCESLARARAAISGVEALTASELRVARLTREGRSNCQIAQELYLSIKTVEGHLARAYDKLDITTRSELDECSNRKKQGCLSPGTLGPVAAAQSLCWGRATSVAPLAMSHPQLK
jgi:DNA-binding CsgD family transcriptional regulator